MPSIRLWPLEPLTEREGGFDLYLRDFGAPGHRTVDGLSVTFKVSNETFVERLLGSLVVWMMPDDGVEETTQTLRDLLEYYSRLHHSRQLLPPPQVYPITHSAIIEEVKRPDLIIAE